MLRKPVFLTSALFIMVVLLAACSRAGTAPTPSTKPQVATAVPAVPEAVPATPQAQAVVQPTSKPLASTPSVAQPAAVEEISVRSGRLTGVMDVREAPDQAANVLGQLPEGSLIIVTGASGEWYEMIYGAGAGGHGWIPQSAVTFELPTATPVPVTPTAVGVAAAAAPASTEATPAKAIVKQPAAAPSKPRASKLAGKLVFQNQNGGDIYLMNADGTGLRRLTTGFEPALSPDGTQVAFTRWDEPRGLWVVNADGSNERLLFGANRARSPTWTPDGASIIFERSTGNYQCASTPFGCLTEEEWRAQFFGQDCIDTPFGTFCFDDYGLLTVDLTALTRLDLASGAERDLPANDRAQAPDQNPIDSSVLFIDANGLEATRNEGNDPPWRLVNAPGLVAASQYSPDGQFIYGSRKSHDHWDLWRWRADGSQATALTAPPALRDRAINSVSPTVSPDGRTVAFLTDRTGKWELWIMNADGSDQRPFAPDALAGVNFRYDFVTERMIDWGT